MTQLGIALLGGVAWATISAAFVGRIRHRRSIHDDRWLYELTARALMPVSLLGLALLIAGGAV